jgi:chemotaxis protein methyltransferase CheR
MSDALTRIAELVRRESGILLDATRHSSLLAALRRVSPESDASSFLRLTAEPAAGAEAVARLIDEVTVKETSFLRDRRQLEGIDWHTLRGSSLAAGSQEIRVWSAACSTGEEPYSLALLACEAFGSTTPPVRILATDISPTALAAAARGCYRERSLRTVDDTLKRRYFAPDGDGLAVSTELRSLVRLATHNLVRDAIPPLGEGPFDLILCRNVLIYFDSETVERLTAAFGRGLAPGGGLVLGAADALGGVTRRLARIPPPKDHEPERRPQGPARELRRPLGRRLVPSRAERLAEALRSADEGKADEALALAAALVAEDGSDPDLHFHRGLIELESGDAAAAIWSLRRALYLDPEFGVAAFTLGRAHEAVGDRNAAQRAYEHALVSFGVENDRDELLLAKIEVADVWAACRTRIAALQGRAA